MKKPVVANRKGALAPLAPLETTWLVVLWLVKHDLKDDVAGLARDLGVNRTTVRRAVDRLLAARILERTPDGGLELGPWAAQAYARRLEVLKKRHERTRLVLAAIGAELVVLTGDGKRDENGH